MPDQPSIGTFLKARREALDASQAFVAWAARVSRNTVGNLERLQGDPEERVVRSVSQALGVNWKRAFDDPTDDTSSYVVPVAAAQRVFEIVSDVQPADAKLAREIMDEYSGFIKAEVDFGAGARLGDGVGPWLSGFIHKISPFLTLTDPRDEALIEVFVERGWSPEDSAKLGSLAPGPDPGEAPRPAARRGRGDLAQRNDLAHTNPLVRRNTAGSEAAALRADLEILSARTEELSRTANRIMELLGEEASDITHITNYLQGAKAFSRLPARLQAALLTGHVADYGVFNQEVGGDVSIPLVALVVRPDDSNVSAVEIAQAVGYWTSTVALASALVGAGEDRGLDLGQIVDQVQGFLHPAPETKADS